MKRLQSFFLMISLVLSGAVLACQITGSSIKPTSTIGPEIPTVAHTPVTYETPSAGFTTADTPTPGLPVSVSSEKLEATVKDYYDALKIRDFERAIAHLSDYSLSIHGWTRQDILAFFIQQDFRGWRFVDYRIIETKNLRDDLALVRVLTKEQTGADEPQTFDNWVAWRMEEGQWRLNWNLVVDDRVPNVEPQTINNLTIQPVRIVRYTNRIRLILKIENKNDRICHWGWGGENIAIFHFGDRVVDVSGRLKIEANRLYPDVYVDVEGFYSTYPSSVDLVGWRWAVSSVPELPDFESSWSYQFVFNY